jgi:hypothetical protein
VVSIGAESGISATANTEGGVLKLEIRSSVLVSVISNLVDGGQDFSKSSATAARANTYFMLNFESRSSLTGFSPSTTNNW